MNTKGGKTMDYTKIKNWPKKIFLQPGPIDDGEEKIDFSNLNQQHITWCEEKQNSNDAEYVLKQEGHNSLSSIDRTTNTIAMSREIKFRIWNHVSSLPNKGKMLNDIESVYECLMQQLRNDKAQPSKTSFPSYDHRSEGMMWMQYTGMKDKNGKEIYEGDILEYEDGNTYKVGYSIETFSGDPSGQYIAAFILVDAHGSGQLICNVNRPYRYAEVVGNIYENPDLLKQ